MGETFWIFLVILLLGYGLGVTIMGRRNGRAGVIVAQPATLNQEDPSGCGLIVVMLIGTLMILVALLLLAS